MSHFKFSMEMLKKEYKKSLVYIITLSLVTAITFLFFNITSYISLFLSHTPEIDSFISSVFSVFSK